MSEFSNVTIEQARAAKEDLKGSLLRDFSVAVGGPVNSIGIGRINTAEYCVAVGLERDPTSVEKNALPEEHMGVKIQYKVVGPIRAL